jgi:hypothetical protein
MPVKRAAFFLSHSSSGWFELEAYLDVPYLISPAITAQKEIDEHEIRVNSESLKFEGAPLWEEWRPPPL